MFEEEEEENETEVPEIRTVRPVAVKRRKTDEEPGASAAEAEESPADGENKSWNAGNETREREEETGSVSMLEKSLRKAALGTQTTDDETKLGAAEEELPFPVKDLAESLLRPLEQVLMREAVFSMGTERWPETSPKLHQEVAGIRAAKDESEVQKLYSQIHAAWIRESNSPERSMTVSVDEPAAAHGMTLKEMDRAVQRDARRYDGGMNLL